MRNFIRTVATVPLLTLAPVAAQPDQRAPLLTPTHTLSGHARLVRCLSFAPNGLLASGGQDALLCVWSSQGKRLWRIDLQPKDR